MTGLEIMQKVHSLQLPEIMIESKEILAEKYDKILNEFDLDNEDDVKCLYMIIKDWINQMVAFFSKKSKKDYRDGIIKDPEDILFCMEKDDDGRKHITNIPYIIADWIGFIVYFATKYDVE